MRYKALHTDKKENESFQIFKEIQRDRVQSHIWLTASSYMVKNWSISSYIRKPFLIDDFAPDPIWISFNMRKILFAFLSVQYALSQRPFPSNCSHISFTKRIGSRDEYYFEARGRTVDAGSLLESTLKQQILPPPQLPQQWVSWRILKIILYFLTSSL